jgi:hypothetical protein
VFSGPRFTKPTHGYGEPFIGEPSAVEEPVQEEQLCGRCGHSVFSHDTTGTCSYCVQLDLIQQNPNGWAGKGYDKPYQEPEA